MPSPNQSSIPAAGQTKPLWPSLVFAAILAVLIPTLWVQYRDLNQLFSTRVFLLPLYIPLAFGLIWPLLAEMQARSAPSLRRLHALRYKVASVLFIVCFCVSAPFAVLEIRSYVMDLSADRAKATAVNRNRVKYDDEVAQANHEILANGLAAFSEPLTTVQELALANHIASHATTLLAEQITRASQHYCCNVLILSCLAGSRNAPSEALQTIYDHSLQLPDNPASSQYGGMAGILESLAANPNTPSPILLAALHSESAGARTRAAGNPNTPKSEKISYLRKAGDSSDVAERLAAARNPATPSDELEKLSSESDEIAITVADNPSTPTTILENILATSKNEQTRASAKHNLDFRRSNR
jgi:hypothetical protein